MEPMNDHNSANLVNTNQDREQSVTLTLSNGEGTEGDDMYLVVNSTNVTPQNVGDDDVIPRLPTENVNDEDLLNEDEDDEDDMNVVVDMATPEESTEGNGTKNDSDNDDNDDAMYDKPTKRTTKGQ